jgi:exopolysaccharide biosynthesis polyprenyl glycosylphosphotransferase
MQFVSRLKREHGRAIELVGIFDPDMSSEIGARDCASVVELGRRNALDRVFLVMPDAAAERLNEVVHVLMALDLPVSLSTEIFDVSHPSGTIEFFGEIPTKLLVSRPIAQWGLLAKESLDKVVSALAIIALSPLLLLIACAIRCETRGPVIFRQKRHGLNNTVFEVLKFRTMHMQTGEPVDGRVQTQRVDKRVTRVGAFLRKTSLDELPQLFNVLRGDMSLVGPRPHPCEMRTCEMLGAEITPKYTYRHRVKPGITGWAQINGHRGALESPEQVCNRIDYDLFYIHNWSFTFDLRILFATPLSVLSTRNAF